MSAEVDFLEDRVVTLDGFEGSPPIMSPAQLAEHLDTSVRTLERWRVNGEWPAFQHPKGTRIYRYYRRDVLAWLENTEAAA